MGKVLRVVIRRSINAVVTMFGIICLNYVLIRLMPGDPNLALVPRNTQFVGLAKANAELFGLDKPPFDQFVIYLQNTVTLNWGYSYFWHAPVADLLIHDLGWTLLLVGTSTVFTILIGMIVGSYAAVKRGRPFDLAGRHCPPFVAGVKNAWRARPRSHRRRLVPHRSDELSLRRACRGGASGSGHRRSESAALSGGL